MHVASFRPLTRLGLALAFVLALCPRAMAAPVKNWSIDLESSVQGTNNLQQQSYGSGDLILRNSLEFSYYPAADADNSALFRVQALNSKFRLNPDFDSTYVIATALASRRVVDSLFGYGGYQLLHKQADAPTLIRRQDNDVFGGLVQYFPLNESNLVFHGYQFDFLRAAVRETSYQGHSAYLTYRQLTTDRWINALSVRSQLRLFDEVGQIEWRNQVTGESTYRVTDWWSVEGEAFYLNSTSTVPGFSFNGWNLALFSRFSL